MLDLFERTELLLGEDGLHKLKDARVAIFGIGGVGGYTVEALARSGVGSLDIIDRDVISPSNINRQIIALTNNIGRLKVDVMKERILNINPDAQVKAYSCFYMPDNAEDFDFSQYDYVVDAVDTVTAKIELVLQAHKKQIPVISSMGAGNKLNPAGFEVADIYNTSVCPLARVMRKELKKREIPSLKVVYSKEKAMTPKKIISDETKRVIPGSIAFVPACAGLIMAGEVIKDLVER